jgi:ADP-ribosylglycohydrolase
MVTHNDHAATASSVGMVHVLWECLAEPGPRPPMWWLEEFVRVAQGLEGPARYRSRRDDDPFEGSLTDYVARVGPALDAGLPVRAACDGWYSGAYVLETMASVLYILGRHADDPEEALVRAVNDTRDNDTIAALVGAAVGALHGRDAFPARWRSALTGRLARHDDGRVFELVEAAIARFVPSADAASP